jgi:nucleoside-diphosphate-sugar epimerase
LGLLNHLDTEHDLDDRLTTPNDADIAFCRRLDGDVLILGAGGKMGPSLARRIVRAVSLANTRVRVIAASRFSSPAARRAIEDAGARAISVDLLDVRSVAQLPDCPNVLFLAGRKFGSADNTPLTWAINTVVPALVARRFREARIVAFSTGNVYPFVPVSSGGSVETDSPLPRGEYAQSCLGRERVFQFFSQEHGTRVVLFRLNYACDLRYGVPVDIARAVKAGRPVDRTVGYINVIWQGDANSYALRAFDGCTTPPRVLNVTGPEILSVTDLAHAFGARFGVQPAFRGEACGEALLSNATACHAWLGLPQVPASHLIDAVADWVEHGGRALDKPTHFEVTNGQF